jgi:hypothetical protein
MAVPFCGEEGVVVSDNLGRRNEWFERLYGRVTKLYFSGMAQHLAEPRTVLRTGARLAYVVGGQASYLQVMIRTGQLLAEIAESLGYETLAIDLFRTRLATATKEQLREEVVVLRWPGTGRRLGKSNTDGVKIEYDPSHDLLNPGFLPDVPIVNSVEFDGIVFDYAVD